MPETTATADNALALELKIDLSKPGRARLLRRLGKGMEASAADKRDFGDSIRDTGSLPPTQTTMGARATSQRSAQSLQTRTRASSPVAGTTRHGPFETTQLSRPGTAAFFDRVRGLAASPCSACRGNDLPVAGSCSPDQTPTGNYTIGL